MTRTLKSSLKRSLALSAALSIALLIVLTGVGVAARPNSTTLSGWVPSYERVDETRQVFWCSSARFAAQLIEGYFVRGWRIDHDLENVTPNLANHELPPWTDRYIAMTEGFWVGAAHGWPRPVAVCGWHLDSRLTAATPVDSIEAWPGMPIPYRVLWDGLLVNLILYFTLSFCLLFGTIHGRRVLRSRSGRCVMCGYHTATLRTTVCPECGHSACDKRSD